MSASPQQIASALEAISAGIRRASEPSASQVSAALQCVVAAIAGDKDATDRVVRFASKHESTEKVATPATAPAAAGPAGLPSRSDVASYLEAMADGIDKAKNPSSSKVAADLRCLLAALDGKLDARNRVARVAAARKA